MNRRKPMVVVDLQHLIENPKWRSGPWWRWAPYSVNLNHPRCTVYGYSSRTRMKAALRMSKLYQADPARFPIMTLEQYEFLYL